MEKQVFNYIQKYHMIEKQDHIVVGVSGGVDSMCLLELLLLFSKQMDFSLEVVCVNHGLRAQAEEEALYVQEYCADKKVPCTLVKADIEKLARELHMSGEEAGRKVRYEAFRQACRIWCEKNGMSRQCCKIAVAHHKNDLAETMLFHLFRGTGLTGLCGIKPITGDVIRPLLCVEREQIEEYAKNKGIRYFEDKTNFTDDYSRNKIRHHIIPYAGEQIVAKPVEHMANTAEQLREAWDYIEKNSEKAFYQYVSVEEGTGMASISLNMFGEEASIIQKNVVQKAIQTVAGSKKDITTRHIEAVLDIANKPGNKQCSLPYGMVAFREYEVLKLHRKSEKAQKQPVEGTEKTKECKEGDFDITIMDIEDFYKKNPQGIVEKKYTKWFDYDKIEQSAVVRTRQMGDYLCVNAQMSKKTLKQYMIDEKIPKARRDHIPVLADGSHILWIVGYRMSEKYKVTENTKRILQVQFRGGCEDGTAY